MSATEKVTYCRICEPLCGMVATVEDGKVTKLRPDGEHPLSAGFACPKGIAMTAVQNDPDRVLYPLRRREGAPRQTGTPPGFERVSWEEALDDIGKRLGAIKDRDGGGSVGWYMGNPGAFSYSHPLWVIGFLDAIGSPHYYSAGSQDVNNRFAASAMLYGSPFIVPIPDLARVDYLFMLGANPLVSHGSVMSAPRVREQLVSISDRGGRVVVIDPRRTETARAFEHVAINPDTDAWLLLAMLNVIFAEKLEDAGAILDQSRGDETLRELCADVSPEVASARTGIPADQIRTIARDLAAAEHAAVYGRTGSCLGRNGTLVSFLLDALNLVTGNLDREGGAMFGNPPVDFAKIADMVGAGTYGKIRSRVGNFPDVLGNLPAGVMAKEITTPGKGQIKAMFVSAGNPVLSVPNGDELEQSFGELELMVTMDFYVNETSKHADYILPATTFLEREDFPIPFLGLFTTPFIQMTEAVVEPAGEARQEWEIIDEISKRIGVAPYSLLALRLLGKVGYRMTPRRMVDGLLRTGPQGDLYGLRRGGLNMKKLRDNPHGIVLGESLESGVMKGQLRHKDKLVRLDPPEIAEEVGRMAAANGHDPDFPLKLIGLRELRSHNSWMHNAEPLMRGEREHAARIHPDDAADTGIDDGDTVRISSAHGAIEIAARLTDEVIRGTIAVPHGWGHKGGWQLANKAGGANVNLLASSDPADLEVLAGMAFLNGIPVKLERVGVAKDKQQASKEEVLAAG